LEQLQVQDPFWIVGPFLNHYQFNDYQKELRAVFADAAQSFEITDVLGLKDLKSRRVSSGGFYLPNYACNYVVRELVGKLRICATFLVEVNHDMDVLGCAYSPARLSVSNDEIKLGLVSGLDIDFGIIDSSAN
jgi:hypothetical protein